MNTRASLGLRALLDPVELVIPELLEHPGPIVDGFEMLPVHAVHPLATLLVRSGQAGEVLSGLPEIPRAAALEVAGCLKISFIGCAKIGIFFDFIRHIFLRKSIFPKTFLLNA